MGKNQQWKDIQRARHARGAEVPLEFEDGRVDVTFHTPEWHAARIASLQVNRLPWDEWQKQRKEQAAKNDLAAAEERMMREYRAQLDAERELKLKKMSSRSLDEDDDSYSKKRKSRNEEDKSKKRHKKKKRRDEKKSSKKSSNKKLNYSSSSTSSFSQEDDGSESTEGFIKLSQFFKL